MNYHSFAAWTDLDAIALPYPGPYVCETGIQDLALRGINLRLPVADPIPITRARVIEVTTP